MNELADDDMGGMPMLEISDSIGVGVDLTNLLDDVQDFAGDVVADSTQTNQMLLADSSMIDQNYDNKPNIQDSPSQTAADLNLLTQLDTLDPTTYGQLLNSVSKEIIVQIIEDIVFKSHRTMKTDKQWTSYACVYDPNNVPRKKHKASIFLCSHCDTKIASTKYASHLEKCIYRVRRGKPREVNAQDAYFEEDDAEYGKGRSSTKKDLDDYESKKSRGKGRTKMAKKGADSVDADLLWTHKLPDILPLSIEEGGCPYIYNARNAEVSEGTAPTEQQLKVMFDKICGCGLNGTKKMCTQPQPCKNKAHTSMHQQRMRKSVFLDQARFIRFRYPIPN